jgi:sulfite exporter TauE/SafE
MNEIIDISVVMTAFLVGLLGSGHCFGMCGGIAAGLGSLPVQDPKKEIESTGPRWSSAFLFNVGRLFSYTVLGLLGAWIIGGAGEMLNVPRWSMILRLFTALMIFLIGLQFMFNLQTLAIVERGGARIWKRVLPLAVRASAMPGGTGRLLVGFCWGFLPCGLVYSVLLTASSAPGTLSGGLVMLAFGVGTLPSMVGMSLAAPTLASLLNDRWTRRLMGAALILLAVLSVSLMVIKMTSSGAGHSMHQHSGVFTVSTQSTKFT